MAPSSYTLLGSGPDVPTAADGHGRMPHSTRHALVDTVAFAAPCWFISEAIGYATVHVIRIGDLQRRSVVSYRTVDGSAAAGSRYVDTSGLLEFQPKETLKSFQVCAIPSTSFDTTLAFTIVLEVARNCVLEPRLSEIPVFIIDSDCFPTNMYKEEIKSGEHKTEAGSYGLLWEFIKYTLFKVPTIWWKSIAIILLDQFSNAYFLASIFMRVYLVDVVLNVKDESSADKLIVPGNRVLSAILLAVAWFAPNLVLLGIEVFVGRTLDMGFAIREHLRVNLFRKMLNYSVESRRAVPIQEMTDALGATIPHLANDGYLGLLDMLKDLGKIFCVAIFMLDEHPLCILGLLFFPSAIIFVFISRRRRSLELHEEAKEAQGASQSVIAESALGIDMIDLYGQKNRIVNSYEDMLKGQRSSTMDLKMFEFWSDQLVPWLTLVVIGLWMLLGSLQVLSGVITTGYFLATITVYKDLGDKFGIVYRRLANAKDAIQSLLHLTRMLNLDTDLATRMTQLNQRIEFSISNIKGSETRNWNELPIAFSNVTFAHIPQIRNLTVTFEIGSIVLVHGPAHCGKSHMLKCITDLISPDEGLVYRAPHQTGLHVHFHPEMITYLNLLDNLRFGANEVNGAPDRVRRIFQQIGIGQGHWLMETLERDIAGIRDDDQVPWFLRASHIERKLIHLARAFVYDPHVLVLHKAVDDVDTEIGKAIMRMLTEFVHAGSSFSTRRTVFLSTGSSHLAEVLSDWADYRADMNYAPVAVSTPSRGRVKASEERHFLLGRYHKGQHLDGTQSGMITSNHSDSDLVRPNAASRHDSCWERDRVCA